MAWSPPRSAPAASPLRTRELQRPLRYQTMETSLLIKNRRTCGFSLVEILVAITVLVIGLTAMAGLVGSSLSGTERARFMALATTLASEKLEDLNRWRSVDPPVAA